MRADPALAETLELELPTELIAALKHRSGAQQKDFHVESWQPSLLGRVVNLFAPKPRS